MLALVRSATTHDSAARMLREFLTTAVMARVATALRVDRPELRAALCASLVVGVIVAREVIALPSLPTTERAVLVAAYGPALQHHLEGPLVRSGETGDTPVAQRDLVRRGQGRSM